MRLPPFRTPIGGAASNIATKHHKNSARQSALSRSALGLHVFLNQRLCTWHTVDYRIILVQNKEASLLNPIYEVMQCIYCFPMFYGQDQCQRKWLSSKWLHDPHSNTSRMTTSSIYNFTVNIIFIGNQKLSVTLQTQTIKQPFFVFILLSGIAFAPNNDK